MNVNRIKVLVKLYTGMIAIGTGGTMVKKASEDAGKLKLKGKRPNA